MGTLVRRKKLHGKVREKAKIHDAVCVEAPEEEVQEARHWMKMIMEDAVEFPLVPLELEFLRLFRMQLFCIRNQANTAAAAT